MSSCNKASNSSNMGYLSQQQKVLQEMKSRKISSVTINPSAKEILHQKHVTRDLIRDMIIPRKNPPGLVALITPNKLSCLKNEAFGPSKEERLAAAKKEVEERDKLRNATMKRKEKMTQIDLFRKQNAKLNDLEEEAKKETEYLCQKANEVQQEQEEEIREINELILASKVQAIRDDQMIEKVMIHEQFKKAEKELDDVMEKNRIDGLMQEEEKQKQRKQEAKDAASLLQEQIESNFENRLLDRERVEQEGEEMRKYFDKLLEEDIVTEIERKEKQKEMRESLVKENNELIKQKLYKKEQSKVEDIRISAIQRLKAEKEEAADAALKEEKRQRELQIAKLREQAERASDLQAEKDALRARRAQEEKERAYRRTEKENAMRNKHIQEDLLKSRVDQLEYQNRLLLLKAEEEQRCLQATIEKTERENEAQEVRRITGRLAQLHHTHELRQQIEENEKKRIAERQNFFFEGFHKKQEEKIRKQKLDALRQMKLNRLKNYDIPPQYLAHIQRKTQLQMTP